MKNLPFYIPDIDLNLRLAKMLLVISTVSKFNKQDTYINLEKLSLLEYLTKHPVLLNKILSQKDKDVIALENYEMFSIEALFPNRTQIFNFVKVKAILNILLFYNLLEVQIGHNYQPSYKLNEDGFELASTFDSQYFVRLKDIINKMQPLLNLSNGQFFSLIDTHSYGSKT